MPACLWPPSVLLVKWGQPWCAADRFPGQAKIPGGTARVQALLVLQRGKPRRSLGAGARDADNLSGSVLAGNGSVNVFPAMRRDRFISVPLRRQAGAIIRVIKLLYAGIKAERSQVL